MRHESAALDLPTARRRALIVAVAILSGFGLVALVRIVQSTPAGPDTIVAAVLLVAAVTAIQLTVAVVPDLGRRHVCLILALQVCLTFGPLLLLGEGWIGMPGFLAGTLLLYARPGWAWVGFVVVVALVAAAELTFRATPDALAYVVVSTTLTGLVTWALIRLTHAMHQLDVAHRDLARSAVVEERLRFARDLHDALGSGLSAMTLKIGIARRVLAHDSAMARAELDEVLAIAQRALDDVRAVADGAQSLTVDDEIRAARSVLTAAGVRVSTDSVRADSVCCEDSTVLALALRETVTNILRHSVATECSITLDVNPAGATLTVVNDGCHATPVPGVGPVEVTANAPGARSHRIGHGLDNLVRRFRDRGGSFVARSGPQTGQFEVVGVIPAPVPDLVDDVADTPAEVLRGGLRGARRWAAPDAGRG